MEKDKKTIATFLGALALIIIMFVTTIVNIVKISKNLSEIDERKSDATNTSYNSSVVNEEVDDNIILKEGNNSYSQEDDE